MKPELITRAEAPDAGVLVPVEAVDASDATTPDGSVQGCDDVDIDAERRFAAWDEARTNEWPFREPYASKSTTRDLDGDGIGEVEWDFTVPPVTMVSHIYRGGACPVVHLATLATTDITLEPGVHDGHADFRTEDYGSFCEGIPCGCVPEVRHYVWSGKEYREDQSRRSAGHANDCEDAR